MAQATRDVVGDVLELLTTLSAGQRRRLMRDLSAKHRRELVERWQGWAQPGQCEPPGDWRIWMIRAGRGFGKTRAGAEWISECPPPSFRPNRVFRSVRPTGPTP